LNNPKETLAVERRRGEEGTGPDRPPCLEGENLRTRLLYPLGVTRFLHTADWQLGMTRHFLEGEAQARFTGARIEVIREIGQFAVEQGCSFAVVGGDVFESNQVERQAIVRALDAMKATTSVTFYLLPGNHDPLDAASVFRSKTFLDHCPPNVVVLEDSRPVLIAPGLEIVGAPWPNKRPLNDLVAFATADLPADGTQRIVVGHGAVDTMSPDPTNPSLISVSDVEASIAGGRVHYVALGDRHSTTDIGTTGRIWYAGTPEPTDYDEIDPGNVLVVELDGDTVSVVPHRVATWRFIHESFDLTGRADCEIVQSFLEAVPDKQRAIVKLSLVGQLSLGDMTWLEAQLGHAADLLGALEMWERRSDLVVLPDDDDFDGLGLSGFAAGALDDLREIGGGSGDDALIARDALGLLYRLVVGAS
jgi:DNA repair exonuclease SbcCD nuclease subunit